MRPRHRRRRRRTVSVTLVEASTNNARPTSEFKLAKNNWIVICSNNHFFFFFFVCTLLKMPKKLLLPLQTKSARHNMFIRNFIFYTFKITFLLL